MQNTEDHNNGHDMHKGMMWVMLVCCLLPVILLFGGVSFFRSLGYNWIGIVLIVIFLVAHFKQIWRLDKCSKKEKEKENVNHSPNKKNDHTGCGH